VVYIYIFIVTYLVCSNTMHYYQTVIYSIIATGHNLGNVEARGKEPEVIRKLTTGNCSVIRVLLHSVLTWSSILKVMTILYFITISVLSIGGSFLFL